jgi:starch synthase
MLQTKNKILLVAPEVAGYAYTGGLGDVVRDLAIELKRKEYDVRVVMPLYKSIKDHKAASFKKFPGFIFVNTRPTQFGGIHESFITAPKRLKLDKIPIYFIEHDAYFNRAGIYGEKGDSYVDNVVRFVYFNRAVIGLCEHLSWIPNVIHLHDWTVGLLPVMIKHLPSHHPMRKTATVFTIHNLEYQGIFPEVAKIIHYAGLPEKLAEPGKGVFWNEHVNMMLAALVHSDVITTVSPTYAKTITDVKGGAGIHGVLQWVQSKKVFVGILNGLDHAKWDPRTDEYLTPEYLHGQHHKGSNYSLRTLKQGKTRCKQAFQEMRGLQVSEKIPLFGVVGRFAHQKGYDMFLDAMEKILREGHNIQFAIVGAGDHKLENKFNDFARKHSKKVFVKTKFDTVLPHQIFAASDFCLVPSRFEPCGLTQMQGMRYGTIPIVRKTGGLADTVLHGKTGWVFEVDADNKVAFSSEIYKAIMHACYIYHYHPNSIQTMRRAGMNQDFSWERSVDDYISHYGSAIQTAHGHDLSDLGFPQDHALKSYKEIASKH